MNMTQDLLSYTKPTDTPAKVEPPITHARIDGIEMGVLPDGTPYLTTRALARMCGQTPAMIYKITREWHAEREKPRGRRLLTLLHAHGYDRDRLFVEICLDGKNTQVIPDAVCMAVLEYYAFEADTRKRHVALHSYRALARNSLRGFIYSRVGYNPEARMSEGWKLLHERMMLNPTPPGYFNLLREISHVLIPAIQMGLILGPHTVPDISVGILWSRYWAERGLDEEYGPRKKYPHRFPGGFPQQEAVDAWIYPIDALGEFRRWMRAYYLPLWFPRYLAGKARAGALPGMRIDLLVDAVNSNVPVIGEA